ncbi:NACHT and Ankyrin domain protein [Metarhizium rileyi]|uniref:NACHT and Ankyrin domain protein n=1 Tax=Metarhizium rileyi (strain RCEF 4871) TaxID=1649241 RepID=A0A162JTF1_METRR|nr:NACHT and Ankyrin domain protein [Metarhizium rileyi RCEF 4871]
MASSGMKRAASVSGDSSTELAGKKRHHLPGTCEWIRWNPFYKTWKSWDESSKAVLCIVGYVGRGKSFLADYIASDMMGVIPDSAVLTTHCSRHSTLVSLVQDLAAQLANSAQTSDSLKERISTLVGRDAAFVPCDVSHKVWDDFKSAIRESQRLTIVIDGLCNMSPEVLSHRGFDLPSKLVELANMLTGKVRLLLVCTACLDILRTFGGLPVIRITGTALWEDMRRFCSAEVAKYPQLEPDSERVSTYVAMNSDGNFNWASLAIKFLAKKPRCRDDVQSRLTKIPLDTGTLYHEAFTLDAGQLLLRSNILRWLRFSVRPMTITEVANAVNAATNLFITDLEAAAVESFGFLVKFEDGYIKLANDSLSRILHEQRNAPSWEQEHSEMAKTLLAYLMHPILLEPYAMPSPKTLRQVYPLTEYASLYWVHHLSLSMHDQVLEDQVQSFLESYHARFWIAKLFPAFLASSALRVSPRPRITAQFAYLVKLKRQIVNYFGKDKQDEIRKTFDHLLESAYQTMYIPIVAFTPAEGIRKRVELAELYSWLPGREDKIAPLLREAMELYSKSDDQPGCRDLLIAARQALADELKCNGQYAEAEELLKSLIEYINLGESSLEHPALPFAYDSLGWVLWRQRKFQDANTVLRKALEHSIKQFGSGSKHVTQTRVALATVLRILGHDEADELCSVLKNEVNDKSMGQQLAMLANTYMLQGKPAETSKTLLEVLDDLKRLLGGDHRLTLEAEMQYGLMTHKAGNAKEAETILSGLLPRQEKVLGPEHQDVKHVAKVLREMNEKHLPTRCARPDKA